MDTVDPHPAGRDESRDSEADARLRAALRALDAEAEREDAVAPDPSRVAGHLAGVGDEDLLRTAAAHPSVRRLLSDVVSVAQATGAEAAPVGPAPVHSARMLSDAVRARAMAAFDATAESAAGRAVAAPLRGGDAREVDSGSRPVRGGLRVVGAGRRGSQGRRGWRAAAAVLALLVPLAVLSLVNGRAEASPVVALDGLDRVGADGAVATEGPRRLGVGDTVTGLAGERLSLRMIGGGRLVLPGEDVVRVACDGARCGRALFALDRGSVVLAVSGDGAAVEPVGLRLPRGDRLDLVAGAAHVSRETGDRVVVVLREDAVAVWTPAEGAPRDLRGALTLVLDGGAGPVVVATADASTRALFRDLEFFGGARREHDPQRRVGARRWRILDDVPSRTEAPAPGTALPGSAVPGGNPPGGNTPAPRATARRSDASGVPALRMDLPAGGRTRLAWEPDEAALLSRRLVVHLRWVGVAPGADPETAPARVRVELEGVPGAFAEGELPRGVEPGALDLELRLPDAWAEGRREGQAAGGGDDLVLAFTAAGRPATVWFECAGFDPSALPSPARPAASSEDAKGPRGE